MKSLINHRRIETLFSSERRQGLIQEGFLILNPYHNPRHHDFQSLEKISLGQIRIFTAKSQRTPRSHCFYLSREVPGANKKPFLRQNRPLLQSHDRTQSESIPEGLSLVIQSPLTPACPAYAEAASRRQAKRCTSVCRHDWMHKRKYLSATSAPRR
jgi:hypothetical protein